ncbi:hypothetical protein TNCT1_61730 [Streptomyces sp. 1-11]|nr:hypothetical protein TNCT1_61730 [Streptomyces sp. 1-11]
MLPRPARTVLVPASLSHPGVSSAIGDHPGEAAAGLDAAALPRRSPRASCAVRFLVRRWKETVEDRTVPDRRADAW